MKKSSAENKPTGKLEDIFRQQFDKAEVNPPADIWSRLEHDLDIEDKNTYRQGMLRYRNIAAVALLLLLATATLLTHNLLYKPESNGNLATVTQNQAGSNQSATSESQEPTFGQQNPEHNTGLQENTVTGTNKAPSGKSDLTTKSGSETTTGNIASERTGSALKPDGATYAYQPALVTKPEKNAPDKPVFKPETDRSVNSIALARPSRSAEATRTATPGKTPASVSDKPTTAIAASKTTKTEPTRVTSANEPAAGKEQLALQRPQTDNQVMEQSSLPQNGITASDKPENVSEIASAGNDKPIKEIADAALVKPIITEPDTSKKHLQQLATLPEELKQEEKNKSPEPKQSKWVLLASLTPQTFTQNMMLRDNPSGQGLFASKQSFDQMAAPTSFDVAIADYEANTKSAFSYQVQVGAGYKIKPKWLLQSGIGFMQNKARTNANYLISPKPPIGSGLITEAGVPVTHALLFAGADTASNIALRVSPYQITYRYRYLQVPVMLTYLGDGKKWIYQISGGITANWLVKDKMADTENALATETYDLRGTSGSVELFNKFLPQATGSFKIGYKLNQHWQILAGPSLALGLRSIVKESNASFRISSPGPATFLNKQIEQKNPVNLGFTIGMSYQLPAKK